MKYYTKEWYGLMQRQFGPSGLRKVPDKEYSHREIREFYEKALAEELERDREIYDTPPSFDWAEKLLARDTFAPENFLFEEADTGRLHHPKTPEEARALLEAERKEQEARFASRPPFNPAETVECFRQCWRMGLRHGAEGFPDWVGQTVDRRLLALGMLPESAYARLDRESAACRKEFRQIEEKAQKELESQNLPEGLRESICFHDAYVLAMERTGADARLLLRKDGSWPGGSPYAGIRFLGVTELFREKGLVFRKKAVDGEFLSNCQYLYDELYRTAEGYELHMLLWTQHALRYLTVRCRDIQVDTDAAL